MDPKTPPRVSNMFLASVFMLSAAGLMFELTLTRIFSATIWYHYAFVAISVALFGWGLGGFLVYIIRLTRFKHLEKSIIVVASIAFSLALPFFLFEILSHPFTPEKLPFYFLLSVLPFLAGGGALSLAFEIHGRHVNQLYFADLIGAALGTLLAPLAIGLLNAETAVLATAILPSLAALMLSLALRKEVHRIFAAAAAVCLLFNVVLSCVNYSTGKLAIRDAPNKALYKLLKDHPEARVESDRWNAYSRITAVRTFDKMHLARLFIDSDAETNVLKWDGSAAGLTESRDWFRAFPFRLAPEPRVLVIGPGGGADMVLSIVAGSPSVTAVEMNPLIIDAVRRFGAEAGNLYDHPKVKLVLDEGRNFIQRTPERFDLIILGFVDSWASVAGGGLSLTENYLYTRDALEAYWDHLTDRGALVIVRWPVDVPRLTANTVEFLSARGMPIQEIGKHLLAASEHKAREAEPVETVFMLSRSVLSESTVDTLLAGHPDAQIIYGPGRKSERPYSELFDGRMNFEQFTDGFKTMATPVRDDRPFYFAQDKPWGIPAFVMRLLRIPVAAVVVFAFLLLAAARFLGLRVPGPKAVLYFSALGAGFIMCEVAMIQRLILLLGHPIYTFVVILFAFLLGGGLGSLFAKRFATERIKDALKWIIIRVILLTVLGAFALPKLVHAAIPLDLTLRIIVAGALALPMGFLMGMPFPLGLRMSAQDPNGAPLSALWGLNGVASVVGSLAGMVLAIVAGFTWVFLASALCYAVAWTTRP